ncbi:MAG: DUF1302 family protein [Pseudomonadota bacterium]
MTSLTCCLAETKSAPTPNAIDICVVTILLMFGMNDAWSISWNISGFIRQEVAYRISGDDNENNRMGSAFNNRITPHFTHTDWAGGVNSTAATETFINDAGVAGFFQQGAVAALGRTPLPNERGIRTVAAGSHTRSPVNCRFGRNNALGVGGGGLDGTGAFAGVLCPNGGGTDFVPGVDPAITGSQASGFSAQGAGLNDELHFNTFNTRAELHVEARLNDYFSAFVKLRAYADVSSAFTDGRVGDLFRNPYWGSNSTVTELAGNRSVIDLPAAYINFNRGPLWIRAGNQTIAWGEAYFFRVMDVVNGLDLRRHMVLSPGGEEYQDQRIASPTLRVTYNFANGFELDAYASMFSPTILPPRDSAYNLIAHGTTLDERDEFEDAKNAINFGARLSMPLTDQLTVTAMYTNRRNPDGVFRFAEAPTSTNGVVNTFCSGANNDTNNYLSRFPGGQLTPGGPIMPAGPLQGAVAASGLDLMPALAGAGHAKLQRCGSSLAPDPVGANSTEFFELLSNARLDPVKALRTSINEWPSNQWAMRQIFGFGEEHNVADALRTIESFHSHLGGFRAFATREFKRESIFALGFNYITSLEDPTSIFDSVVIRGEVAVTPDKQFTDLGLSFDYIRETEITSALIIEKFHRFSEAIPATYMVWQWMHREASDLFGRHLSGTESRSLSEFVDPATGLFTPAAFIDGAAAPRGSDSADYIVFAFQQPSASLRWRLDFAMLIDVEGGVQLQPGVRFKPDDTWQFDLYANIIQDGGDRNDDIMETLDFADEIFARVSWYF